LQHLHRGQLGCGAHLGQTEQARLAHQLHVDLEPARLGWRRFGVVIGAGRVELRGVAGQAAHQARQAGDARLRAGRVIEQHAVAGLHGVAHEIAGLVVAHAGPGQRLARCRSQVIDRSLVGLTLHQPIAGHQSVHQEFTRAGQCE